MDFAGRLMLNHLGNQLLNAAGTHAEECGFGMNFLNKNHYTWVLSRLALECSEYPTQNEWFYIDTWLENVMNFFFKKKFYHSEYEWKNYRICKKCLVYD